MSTQPRLSIELVKKSPRRRSLFCATHSVPPWHTDPVWMPRRLALTLSIVGLAASALRMCASPIETSESSQSRSTTLFDWYQTTEIFPASPAATHGQNTRPEAVCATVVRADHVLPKSREIDRYTLFASGFGCPQLSFAVLLTGLSSQTAYTLSALSSAIAGQCANIVESAILCGVNWASPRFQVPTPRPVTLPSLPMYWIGSIRRSFE